MGFPASFPVARYRLEFTTERPIRLPEYAGSALRGVFGHALRRAACVTGARDCAGCALVRRCAYPAIFETPPPLAYERRKMANVPHPFVVEPPAWGHTDFRPGDTLAFDLVLIGPALRQLPHVLLAWRHALAAGLGPQQGSARLRCVSVEGEQAPVLAEPEKSVRAHSQELCLSGIGEAPAQVTLVFETPLRLQSNGRALGIGELTPHHLLMALLRRVAQLIELQLGGTLAVDFAALGALARAIGGDHDLRWRDWTRHSNRQGQHMVLGGAVGRWTLRGDLAPFWPLLVLGQWLHVGKNATFDLGRFRLESDA